MKKTLLIIGLVSLLACSKEKMAECNRIKMVSDKYFTDSTFWKSDTDRFDYGCVPQYTVDSIYAMKDSSLWSSHCFDNPPFIEHKRYIVNGKDVYPFILFKK